MSPVAPLDPVAGGAGKGGRDVATAAGYGERA